jgi:hypothetical protein
MLSHLGVHADTVHFFNNRLKGVDFKVAYRSGAAYGAKSKGWEGIVDIADAVNNRPVIVNFERAATFFD